VAWIDAGGSGKPELALDENTPLWDISPDGKMIAYAYWPHGKEKESIAVANIETSEIRYRFDIEPRDILRWTPDGKQLVYEMSDPKNLLGTVMGQIDLDASGQRLSQTSSGLVDYALDRSPDGNSIAYVRGREISNLVMLSAN
jgi:Tol biopolymer transport system component